MTVTLTLVATLLGACDLSDCPDGTPDDVYILPATELDLPEVRGDSRQVGDYGGGRVNGVYIGYLFQHPDLGGDPLARNEWIGHLVFEWPEGDSSGQVTLTSMNCRFVVDPDGGLSDEVDGSMPTIQLLPGYLCDGTASRESSGKDIYITFDARLVEGSVPVGRVHGEYRLDYRAPVCGGAI